MKNLQELAIESRGVTISEAAKIIGISRTKMYKLLGQKKIETFVYAGSPRIKHKEIETFLKSPE